MRLTSARLPARLPAALPARLPAALPAVLPARLPAALPALALLLAAALALPASAAPAPPAAQPAAAQKAAAQPAAAQPAAAASPASRPAVGDTTVFARVGAPGHPDTSIVLPGGDIAVSTNRGARGAVGPSKVLRYRPDGRLVRTYVVRGQSTGDHGAMGMAVDARGRLYVADYAPARVLRIDLRTGAQETYATLPDLPACPPAQPARADCDNGVGDSAPWTDGLAFDAAGRLLVTDLAQGTVFRVPNGGGRARVWLQGPELRSAFGPNQLALDARGDLLLSVTASTLPALAGRGALYRVDVRPDGAAGRLALVHATAPGEGPDGFALGRSGRVYLVTLVTDRLLVLRPDGTLERAITRPKAGPTPFDSPSSATLVGGGRLLVTNLTYFTGSAERALVLSVHVGDEPVRDLRPAVR